MWRSLTGCKNWFGTRTERKRDYCLIKDDEPSCITSTAKQGGMSSKEPIDFELLVLDPSTENQEVPLEVRSDSQTVVQRIGEEKEETGGARVLMNA